jgi:hypothetical protein
MLKLENDWYSPLRDTMKLPPIGAFSFEEIREKDRYYVDKTPFIKTALESSASVLLITRPRRFGKSLFMDAMYRFLEVDFDDPGSSRKNAELFSELKILEDKKFCDANMGQYPVLFITLKDVKDNNFIDAYKTFAEMISGKAREFEFLKRSPRLNEDEKETFAKYTKDGFLGQIENKAHMKAFLKNMILYLGKHFQRKVIVLIDEYDVPLAKAAKHGYYDEMIPIIQGFLGQALKPESACSKYLQKSVLTGCLRVSKESIFTDFNNPDVNTVCSDSPALSDVMGFTAAEVKELLSYYGLEHCFESVKYWYDGYQFAGKDIYCPWDVIKFTADAIELPKTAENRLKNYWINTSGNDVIDEFLGFLTGEDAEKMQALVDGGAIEVEVNEALNYGDFKNHKAEDFWTLLLFTGYLTIAERLPEGASCFKLKIPNEEIRDTFVRKVKNRFSSENADFSQRGNAIARALLTGDTRDFYLKLTELLQGYVSIRDTATKSPAENFYHGFLSAIFTSATVIKNFQSNAEAGNGYADILFVSQDKSVGVVIEIKRCEKEADSADLCQKALDQIAEKGYENYFPRHGITCKEIYAYGLVFFGKDCNVLMQKHEVKSN